LKDSGKALPCLILLDLNMPQMNGIEFLAAIKRDANLKRIPVVVFTTSAQDTEILESYRLGVAGYMIKPVDYRKFLEIIKTLHV
jgi:CheY-like chemotaxis protein